MSINKTINANCKKDLKEKIFATLVSKAEYSDIYDKNHKKVGRLPLLSDFEGAADAILKGIENEIEKTYRKGGINEKQRRGNGNNPDAVNGD